MRTTRTTLAAAADIGAKRHEQCALRYRHAFGTRGQGRVDGAVLSDVRLREADGYKDGHPAVSILRKRVPAQHFCLLENPLCKWSAKAAAPLVTRAAITRISFRCEGA